MLKDLEILARAGKFAALDLTFTAVVTDGQLNIAFAPSNGVATINAIIVRGVDFAGPTPTPSIRRPARRHLGQDDRAGGAGAAIIGHLPLDAQPTRRPPRPPTRPRGGHGNRQRQCDACTDAAADRTPTPTPTRTRTTTPTPTRTRTATPGGPVRDAAHVTAKKGVGGGEQPDLLRQLGVSWSYTWYIAPNNFNTVYEHVPMIWGKDYDPETVTTVARAHPGSYWLIWNEPDYWQQANISPLQAAQIYRTLRPLIKAADPTAKLIVGGVFNLNVAGWRASAREYNRLYGEWPAVEGWHVHHYVGRTEYDTATWRDTPAGRP